MRAVPLWTDPKSVTAAFTHIAPPVATTTPATAVYQGHAWLNGTVNTNGFATSYHFEYGKTSAYGTNTPTVAGPSASSPGAQPVQATVSGLAASTLYHYRVVATNAGGVGNGADATFTTGASVPPPPPPPPLPPRPTTKCHVPGLKGNSLAKARVRIRAQRCSLGKVRYARSKKRRGLVIGQSPPAGKALPARARVNLVLSRGRKR